MAVTGSAPDWGGAAHQIAARAFGWLDAAIEYFALPADACTERVPQDTAKAFRNHYHPAVVAAIAGTLAVSRRIS